MKQTSVQIDQLTFRYHRQTTDALHAVSCQFAPQQLTAVIGAAGSGKSTLCAMIAGYMPQFFRGQIKGSISVDQQSPLTASIIDMLPHVTLVTSQASSQISGVCFTVADEVGFALQNLGYAADLIQARVAEAMETMEITHLATRSPFALSGGQQQRMVIAAALALQPPVLIFDEPTAQLDPPAVAALGITLRKLAQRGHTVIVTEHQLDWVMEYADEVYVLHQGHMIAHGTPRHIFAQQSTSVGRPYLSRLQSQLVQQGICQQTDFAQTVEQLSITLSHDGTMTSPTVSTDARPATIVHVADVHFAYTRDTPVLNGVDMRIGAGERIALLGRNGAGKSTLLRHLNGLLRPSQGTVYIHGSDIAQRAPGLNARHLGIVFQDVRNQLFAATVRDEIAFGPQNLGLATEDIQRRVEHALHISGLTDVADTHPYDLPPARRRLVATAAIMALESDVIALDEPSAGLDEASIDQLVYMMDDVVAHGRSVVLVSHDLNLCAAYTERIILIRAGQVALDSTWQTLTLAELQLLDDEVGLPLGHKVALINQVPPQSTLGQQLCDPRALR